MDAENEKKLLWGPLNVGQFDHVCKNFKSSPMHCGKILKLFSHYIFYEPPIFVKKYKNVHVQNRISRLNYELLKTY